MNNKTKKIILKVFKEILKSECEINPEFPFDFNVENTIQCIQDQVLSGDSFELFGIFIDKDYDLSYLYNTP